MKNTFYFMSKTLFVLKIFKFLFRHARSYRENGLMNKLRLISKFITPQTGK